MARPLQVGTVEWFKEQKQKLIELAKAVDSFAASARELQKIVELGAAGDADVRSALHSSAVVTYARPFSNNKSGDGHRKFPERELKGAPGFDKAIHDQLLTLRDKLIAHSDSDYADGRLFAKSLVITPSGADPVKVLAGVQVMTVTVHLIEDIELAKRFLAHVHAVEQAAYAKLSERAQEYVTAARQSPAVYDQAADRSGRTINVGPFQVSPESPEATLPIPDLDPRSVLKPPPLAVGQDGYSYRMFAVQADLPTLNVKVRTEDGSEAEFSIAPSKRTVAANES